MYVWKKRKRNRNRRKKRKRKKKNYSIVKISGLFDNEALNIAAKEVQEGAHASRHM